MLDLVLTGGQIATGSSVFHGNIGIKDGKIVIVSDKGIKPDASRTIDAIGKIISPGVIDPHVHYRGITSEIADGPEEASVSAAHGGMTTFLVFSAAARLKSETISGMRTYRAVTTEGVQVEEYFGSLIEENQRVSVIDFGIHWYLLPNEDFIRQIPLAMKMGITSFKMMLGYHPLRGNLIDDRLVYWLMEEIARNGGLAQVHAENGYVIGYLEDKFLAEGRYTKENFLAARPNLVEAEAVYRLTTFAGLTGCPLYVVHLSSKEGLENIIRAKSQGWNVTAETCPQYLLFTQEDMTKQGALLKCAPPPRTVDDNNALWRGIQEGFIETIGSDHGPYERDSQKLAATDWRDVPFGIPGVETLLPLVYSEGVAKGRITLSQMVQLLCENPAKKFGLYPRKGVISIGADADLVIIDPTIEWQIKGEELHSEAGYTPFEGWQVKGKPIMSLLRGEVLLEGGQLHQKPGFGRFLHRPLS